MVCPLRGNLNIMLQKAVCIETLETVYTIPCPEQLAESLILSVVDYCNALFTNAQKQDIKRLQKLQNACCSFVLNKYCNHWLVANISINV